MRTDQVIIVNEIGLHMSPVEWVHFRNWAGLSDVQWDSPVLMSKIDEFRQALKQAAADLFYWQRKDATNFTAYLYGLIGKADPINRARIAEAFPIEALAWVLWQSGPEKEFYERFGLGRSQ